MAPLAVMGMPSLCNTLQPHNAPARAYMHASQMKTTIAALATCMHAYFSLQAAMRRQWLMHACTSRHAASKKLEDCSRCKGRCLWPLARRFSSIRLSMKSMASTERAASASEPVKRPMPAPSSTTRAPSTQPSMPSTWAEPHANCSAGAAESAAACGNGRAVELGHGPANCQSS